MLILFRHQRLLYLLIDLRFEICNISFHSKQSVLCLHQAQQFTLVDTYYIFFGLEVVFSVLNMLIVWLFLDFQKSLILLKLSTVVALDTDAFLDSMLFDQRASRLTLLRQAEFRRPAAKIASFAPLMRVGVALGPHRR